MITGTEVSTERTARGWSRKRLATETGLTEGKIWRIEHRNVVSQSEDQVLRQVLRGDTDPADSSTATSTPTPQVETASRPVDAPATAASPGVATVQPEQLLDPFEEDDGVQWLDVDPVYGTSGGTLITTDVVAAEAESSSYEITRLISPTELTLVDGIRRVSNSELQTFKDCRRRWWLAYYRGLKIRRESPVGARAVGDRVHRALKAWYVPDGQVRTDPRDALERLIVEDWTTICRNEVDVVNGRFAPDADLTKRFQQDADLERAMIEGYVEWLAETGADSELKITASETYIEGEILADPPVRLIGKLDVRARRTSDNVRLFIDHKTVGNFTTPTRLLPLNEQMLTYHLLEWLNTDEGEERCDGALYNMLRRVKRSTAAKPPFFQRVEVRHNVHEIKSMRERVIGETIDLLKLTSQLDAGADHHEVAYPRPTEDCAWKCPFFAVCGMFDDGSRVEAILDEYYEEGDPLEYYQIELKDGATT